MTTTRALSSAQIIRAAVVVLLGFLASGILGLVRTAAYSASFGASPELDAFYAAQQIPELLFTLVAGGALGSSFIPVFTRFIARDDSEAAWRLASAVMTLSGLAAFVLGLFLALTAPLYMPLLIGSAPETTQELTVHLTQLMMVTTLIFAVSGLLMGILNAHQNFMLPALALSMNNIGLIIGALVIAPLIPTDSGPFAYAATHDSSVYGLAFGAILGALLHLGVQLPGLLKLNARLRFNTNWRAQGVGEVLKLMIPRVFGLAVTRLNFLVSVFFASTMIAGSYSALNTAWFLMFFALGVIAQSMGTAVFPSLSSLAAEGNMDGYKQRLMGALRSVLFLSFPATVALIVLGQPLTSLLERGAWTPEHTAGTAWALAFFAVGIAGHSALEVLSRAFYALSDTRTPVLVGVASLLANIVLSALFIQFIGDPESIARGAFAGLALSNSVTTLLEGLALGWLMRRRIGGLGDPSLGAALLGTLIASLGAGAVMYGTSVLLWSSGSLIVFVVAGAAGGAAFFALAFALGIKEARTIPAVLLGRFSRR